MIEKIKIILTHTLNDIQKYIFDTYKQNYQGESISFENRRLLNECLETFYQVISNDICSLQDKILLERAFLMGENVIFEKLLHFGNYYYSKETLIRKDFEEKESILRKTNVETSSFLNRIRAYELRISNIGGSTDDYFVGRLPQLLDGISYAVDKNIDGLCIPILYNLLNLHQTII
jgi:hypothetical protein